jgi:hypothetical protein
MTHVAMLARRSMLFVGVGVIAVALGRALVVQPELVRVIAAAALGLLAVVFAAEWPRRAVVATLVFLPFLALTRRLLLDLTPWQSTDPLLLVAPAVVAILLVRRFVLERRPIATDRVSKLVLLLIALCLVQVLNPRGGSVSASAAALLFTAIPLCWFFVGREYATTRMVTVLFSVMVASASAISVYGLWQTWSGLPSWDAQWVEETGYGALRVGEMVRAFGTFSSSAEYAFFIAIAIVVACSFALGGRPLLLPAVPLLAVALFF